jgi:hypothetical protein
MMLVEPALEPELAALGAALSEENSELSPAQPATSSGRPTAIKVVQCDFRRLGIKASASPNEVQTR